jgi:hypothetical protein
MEQKRKNTEIISEPFLLLSHLYHYEVSFSGRLNYLKLSGIFKPHSIPVFVRETSTALCY